MQDLRGKRLLLLEGTTLTKMIIDKAHELGIYVVIANWYSVEDAPAKAYADKEYTVNIFDIPAMLEIIKEEKIDGLFTAFTDSHLHIYEQICRAANLPCFTNEDLVDVMVEKDLFKKKSAEAGLPVIDEYDAERILSDKEYAESVVYPVIVKPVDNSGARGISICHNSDTIEDAIKRGLEYSKSGKVIIEKYLRIVDANDTYCLADFFIQDGKAYFVASSDKPINDDDKDKVNLPGAYVFPSVNNEQIRNVLEEKVQKFVSDIGYKNGLLCFELIRSGGEIYIIEAQFRFGAKFQEVFLLREYGIDETEMLFRHALTGDISEYDLTVLKEKNFSNHYALMNILLKAGKLGYVQDEAQVREYPSVIDYYQIMKLGTEINPDGSMVQMFGKVAFAADTREKLFDSMRHFQSNIDIRDEDGNRMVISSL